MIGWICLYISQLKTRQNISIIRFVLRGPLWSWLVSEGRSDYCKTIFFSLFHIQLLWWIFVPEMTRYVLGGMLNRSHFTVINNIRCAVTSRCSICRVCDSDGVQCVFCERTFIRFLSTRWSVLGEKNTASVVERRLWNGWPSESIAVQSQCCAYTDIVNCCNLTTLEGTLLHRLMTLAVNSFRHQQTYFLVPAIILLIALQCTLRVVLNTCRIVKMRWLIYWLYQFCENLEHVILTFLARKF